MREYIISIAGAAILSGLVKILSPAGWQKYIKIITGLIIISIIAAPIRELKKINIFSEFSLPEGNIDEEVQIKKVKDELAIRVQEDINKRVYKEFFETAKSSVVIDVNEKNEIVGVLSVKVITKADSEKVKKLINEIYGVEYEEVSVVEP